MAERWKAAGIHVDVLFGVDRPTDADLLIPHLDLSYLPDRYWDFIQHHPNSLNRGVRDIRKTSISRNAVHPGDAYDGPVIVKTDGNCGGCADVWFGPARGPSLISRVRTRLARIPWVEPRSLGWTRTLTHYPIFPSPRHVPRGAYRNPHLLVERFLPERRGERFVLRQWIFMGPHAICRVRTSTQPDVKSYNSEVRLVDDPIPPEIIRRRTELRMDYGKIDFVIHGGMPVLLDVNPTPTIIMRPGDPELAADAVDMARGIEQFEGRAR